MKKPICEKLDQLNKNGSYPFHMPGHKRNYQNLFQNNNIFEMDITEITGYDDLHQPEGIIRESMDFVKEFYGTKESYFLINSSTAGNLAAISALCQIGDKILVARNCHKSVYHGIELLNLDPVYVYPEVDLDGICKGITAKQVENVIKEEKNIRAAIIVSPTYEGRVSEIEQISKMLHENHIPLIVDEAHGAHFIYHNEFPKSAVCLGADLVIQSLHKTLPSLTQTGLLHLCSDCISKEKMQKKLSIFQSSSPSYILMASIDSCIHDCMENQKGFQQYVENIYVLREQLERLQHFRLVETDDIGKIVISTRGTNITGQELFEILRDVYGLELEMAEIFYVTAMTSLCDTKEGFQKLGQALMELDRKAEFRNISKVFNGFFKNKKVMNPEEAGRKQKRFVNLDRAIDMIGADFVYLYPPGIPLIVPGEVISKDAILQIESYEKNHMKVVGCSNHKINIIDERI